MIRKGIDVVPQAFTGSMFSIQDVSSLNFSGNTFSNISSQNQTSLVMSQNTNSVTLQGLTLTDVSNTILLNTSNTLSNFTLESTNANNFTIKEQMIQVKTQNFTIRNVSFKKLSLDQSVKSLVYSGDVPSVYIENFTISDVSSNQTVQSMFDVASQYITILSSTFDVKKPTQVLNLNPSK
jgi:hypothetical protein